MREIKFRAWDARRKRMSQPDDDAFNWISVSDMPNLGLEFMQFTGLLDKNGKEIYQGDLLRITPDKEGYGDTSYSGVVEVTVETCGYKLKPISPTFEEMEARGEPWDSTSLWHVCEEHSVTGEGTTEIIGNLYENSELLK